MQTEYLILNILIIVGPLFLSFDRQVRYKRYWTKAFLSIGVTMIPFLLWDMAVSGIHWHFNEKYILPFRFLGLPAEEFLFFVTVPFSCLFIWQIIVTRQPAVRIDVHRWLTGIEIVCFLGCLIFLFGGKVYTAVVCFGFTFVIFYDKWMNTHLLRQKRTYLYLIIITVLIFIFNGYLTARPVVLYASEYLTGIRLWTIPLEDFGYGYILILLCTVLYEKLKGLAHG